VPGGTYFLPNFFLLILDVLEAERLALFKIRRDPDLIVLLESLIELVYRIFQKLVIGNYDLQPGARDTPLNKCLAPLLKCSNNTVVRKVRSIPLVK